LAYAGAIRSAKAAGKPDLVAHAIIASAKAESAFGNRQLASSHLREAALVSRTISEPSLRDRVSAELDIVEGQFEAASDSRHSLRAFNSAAAFFVRKGDQGRMAQVHFERGKSYLAAGNRRLATRDFMAAIAILETVRSGISGSGPRISYFENAQHLFDYAITTLAESGQIAQAADVVEQARARALLDLIEESVPSHSAANLYEPPLQGDGLRRRLPPLTTVIEYVSLANRVLIFVIDRTAVRMATVPTTAEQVSGLIRMFFESATEQNRRQEERPAAAVALYRLLFSPVRGQIREARTLVFIPDKSLYLVPFGALRSPETDRYLIEDFQVGVSPSATIFVRATERYRSLSRSPGERLLLVTNPRFDRRLLPDLRPLPRARDEAREIAAFYPNTVVLSDADATRRRFLAEAPTASLIHLASHALIERQSILSKLVLAPDSSVADSGLLYAHEIAALHLPRTRVVVLSACETLAGTARGGEGVISLSRAFLAAGVPAVLGTLAPVDDRVAAAMLTEFHRRLAGGDDPLAALRGAQLALSRGAEAWMRPPSVWGSLELIGGAASVKKGEI
jgi:CHAT domain-containing protein